MLKQFFFTIRYGAHFLQIDLVWNVHLPHIHIFTFDTIKIRSIFVAPFNLTENLRKLEVFFNFLTFLLHFSILVFTCWLFPQLEQKLISNYVCVCRILV